MRVMVMVKANEDSEAGVMPSTELLTAMGKFNEELVKAGIMEAGEGLHPSSKGVRIRFDGDPNVPRERFTFLRERLGDGFVAVELRQEDGHPDGPLGKRHSVLTGDLVDEPGEPSRAALDQVLEHFRTRLVEVAP